MKIAHCTMLAAGLLPVLVMVLVAAAPLPAGRQDSVSQEIRLIVRADDMGVCHAANEACIAAYRQGIVRSVEVIVPGQWFLEAARMLAENPALDVGVHLCLTSEWDLCKWRPITHAASLADENGYFHANNKAFLDARPKIEEVEAELRAQIDLARKHIRNVTHLSVHMGTATATDDLRRLAQRLAEEYKLPLESKAAKSAGGFGPAKTAQQKEEKLVAILQNLTPGLWLFVEHPGLDTPEMRAMGHKGYQDVAADRDAVTRALTSQSVMKVIQTRNIKLLSYAQAKQDSDIHE